MATFLKRLFLVISALALILSVMPAVTTQTQAYDAYEYGYALLKNDYERTIYRAMVEGIRNCDTTIEIGIAPKNYQESLKQQYVDEINKAILNALRLVMADHPEFFWFDGNGDYAIQHDSWTTFKVIFHTHDYSVNGNSVNKNNVNQYIQQVENAANQILKNMPTDRDLAKIHYLHDYLATHINYLSDNDDQTIYGALVEGEAVCAGYARAYQYLLTKAGVRCWYVTGHSISPSTMNKVNHAWNLVYLDGKCYYTDVTWDDQDETFHAYYMLSKAEMNDSHFPDHPEDLPASCGHTDLDYFEVHKGNGTGVGVLVGSYNANQLAACMKKVSDDTWSCHVEDLTGGGPHSFAAWLENNGGQMATAVAAALGIKGDYSWSLNTLWDEYQFTLQSLPYVHYHDRVLYGVAAKAPTCTQSGNKGYYVCNSCGAWFENWNGEGEIHDKDSVKIPALDHTYTKQCSNADQHWIECKDCGLEQLGSREIHYDNNKNGKCDVCNADVEIPTEPTTEATTAATQATNPATQATNPATQATNPGTQVTNPSTNPSEEPTQGATTESSAGATGPTDETVVPPTDDPVTQPSEGQESQPSESVTESTGEPTTPGDSGTENATAPTEGKTPTDASGAIQPSQSASGSDAASENNLLPIIIGAGIASLPFLPWSYC